MPKIHKSNPEDLQHTLQISNFKRSVISKEHQTLQQMRWFLLILVAIGFLASTTIGIVAFLITRNPYTLTVIPAPTILIHLTAGYLLPMDDRRFYLALKKLEMKAQQANEGKRLEKATLHDCPGNTTK